MSNLRDSLPERNVDGNRPSTSQSQANPTSRLNKAQTSPSKKSPKHTTMSRQMQQAESKMASRVVNNSYTNDLSAQYKNLSVNSESDGVDQGDCPDLAKRKNAKKKERQKQLHLQMPPTNVVPPQPQTSAQEQAYLAQQNYLVQNQVRSMQDFFMNQVGPLYATTGSRYMENLAYHPQYQYMQNMQAREMQQNRHRLMSVPNTPLLHAMQRPISANTPTSPLMLMDPTTPRFFQNMMQHPLLSRSLSVENPAHLAYAQRYRNVMQNTSNASFHVPQGVVDNKSHTKTKKNSKTTVSSSVVEDKTYDQYLSVEEVEIGLKNNSLIEGILRINPKQFQHSYVSNTDRSEQDILIDGIKNRNRALEGDVVVVELLSDSETEDDNDDETKQKKGKVVYIKVKVHTRTCIGTLKLMSDKNRQKALFVPRDHRIPRLNVPFTCWPDNFYQDAKKYENTLFLAKILDWSDTRFATGEIVCNIGQSGNMITETRAILAQTDLDITPYGTEFRDLYPRLDYVIPEDEMQLREDCRRLCLFSIDPSNCRDIDDAVSCRQLDNGNYEIGVHISDVSHFLTENTPLDQKVADKATTIYMVERAYHMLPDELCMLCSLFPGVDKLAFSVFWEITPDADVLNHRFSKTVIHSCGQLSYDHAQAILEDKEDAESIFPETYNGFQYKDIYKSIKVLGKMSSKFRRNRFDNGALRIDQPKVSFHLNTTNGLPESFWIYDSKESHQLIEEFMLLANMTVAERIHDDHPNVAFLRCHPPPSGYMLRQLATALKPMGIELNISSAGELHHSLLQHVGHDSTEKGKAMVLNMLCAKPMARAKYFCAGSCNKEDFPHYALNVPLYTHFTSPIRRYADIMVHRLLAASLKYRETPNWDADRVRMIAAQCNKQKYNARIASLLSTELYTLKYIEMHSPVVTEGVVVEVREKYIDIIIVAMGLNRRIYFNNDFQGEFKCIKNDAGVKLSKMELTWRSTDVLPPVKQVIEVFSILKVQMHKSDDMVKVETKLVRPQ